MAKLYKTNGEIVEDINIETIDRMQNWVGGYIELVPVQGKPEYVAIVNEEGLLLNLDYNENASSYAGIDLVGNVIICKRDEIY
jgi:hypothetical protein